MIEYALRNNPRIGSSPIITCGTDICLFMVSYIQEYIFHESRIMYFRICDVSIALNIYPSLIMTDKVTGNDRSRIIENVNSFNIIVNVVSDNLIMSKTAYIYSQLILIKLVVFYY